MPILDSFRLDGRTALVTGAGSGLGLAMAVALAEAGATVGCLDINGDAAMTTAATITAAGGRAVGTTADVASAEQVQQAVGAVTSALGPIDLLFNVAGVAASGIKLHELPEAEWHRRLAVNLNSIYLLSKAVLPGMIQRRRGRIINVSSIWGNVGSRKHPITEYAAAKGAIVNLTREMAMQYAPEGILVNAICPGFFRTNLTVRYADPAWVQATAESVPLGRTGEPREIAGLAVFLAAPASGYITGQCFTIDGGFSAY